MNYISVQEARERSGLRLVLSAGVPGPWSEAAKALVNYKKLPWVAVFQEGGGVNEDLKAWSQVWVEEPGRLLAEAQLEQVLDRHSPPSASEAFRRLGVLFRVFPGVLFGTRFGDFLAGFPDAFSGVLFCAVFASTSLNASARCSPYLSRSF